MVEERNLMQGVSFSHFLLKKHLSESDTVIDATAGNGKDTVFLAELLGNNGRVFAFDIQKEAINHTRRMLELKGLADKVELIEDSHVNILNHIDVKVDGIIFNLGFLPGGSRKIITRPDTTIIALKEGLSILKSGGIIVLVIYTGHSGGEEEKEALIKFCSGLDYKKYNVLNYNFINQRKPPARVLAVKKRLRGTVDESI